MFTFEYPFQPEIKLTLVTQLLIIQFERLILLLVIQRQRQQPASMSQV